MNTYTLGKNERLKSRKQIELLFARGKSFSLPPFRVYYAAETVAANNIGDKMENLLHHHSSGSWSRLGVGVSSRHFKRATDRNRMKRLVRESWRLQKNELNAALEQQGKQLNVFFIYTAKDLADFESVKKATASVVQKLLRMQEKKEL